MVCLLKNTDFQYGSNMTRKHPANNNVDAVVVRLSDGSSKILLDIG